MRQHLLLLLFPLLLTTQATAQPVKTNKDAAAALFSAAEIFFQTGEYERALRSYTESYQLSSFSDLLFNIGQCYRALNRHAEALASYQEYLAAVPNSPIRKEVEGWIAELKPLAAQEKQTQITPPVELLQPPASLPITAEQAPTKEVSNKRFALPLGLSLGGLALASGAILTNNKILATQEITNSRQYTRLALAVSADVAFIGAGASLLLALRKREPTAMLTPLPGGALFSVYMVGGAR